MKRMELQKNYFQYELTDGGWQQVSERSLANGALMNEAHESECKRRCLSDIKPEGASECDGAGKPEDASEREGLSAGLSLSERLLTIQVTEYSHDDRPDIWYKPEIVHLCGDAASRARAREQFIKYGLPAIIRQTCWADLDELRASITKGLAQEI
ncbi:MAG: hypothetical protein EKK48_10440 [Candidatus Melainabacteria bacterium]|nr:MAG: hypothetical protein EKK48_10440 [Candidatus Melainabacteria bacterium]